MPRLSVGTRSTPSLGTPIKRDTPAIREIVELGEHYGIEVRGAVRRGRATENAILKEIEAGRHTLLVMGVSPRPGEQLFFGDVPAELLERAACSILFVSSEHR